MDIIRECKHHGLTNHAPRSEGGYRCRQCIIDAVNKRRRILKQKAVEYKGGKCIKCGYNKYVGALEFHHIEGEKDFGISAAGTTKSWEKIKKELDKCIIVCSNCHKEIHGDVAE